MLWNDHAALGVVTPLLITLRGQLTAIGAQNVRRSAGGDAITECRFRLLR
jgi:hypothetical protein